MIRTSRISAIVAAAFLALTLSACTGSAERLEPVETAASQTDADPLAPAADGAPTDVVSDEMFAERDAFFVAQGGAPDPSKPLVAVTPEQKDFVAQQRAYVTAQGGQVDEQYDTVILALALDACESSILNAHQIDESSFAAHVSTSPLVAALLPSDGDDDQRAAAARNLMSVAVFGTTFLCPADAPQWQQAAAAYYGQ